MVTPIRILLADDHPPIRFALRALLSNDPTIHVIDEVGTGHDALARCQALQPDMLVLDLSMPGPATSHVLSGVRRACPAIKILILTAYATEGYLRSTLPHGISGYVLKDEALDVIPEAIRTVGRGYTWFSQTIADRLFQWNASDTRTADSPTLTRREVTLLSLIAQGQTDQDIGMRLGLAERSVRYNLRRLYDKLGVNSRIDAAVRATQLRFIDPDTWDTA
jgi:DNA-binding NarL/FixJ family response regulator